MGLNVFYLAALAALAAALAAAVYLKCRKSGEGLLTPMNVLFTGVILGGILLFTPAYFVQQHDDGFRGAKSLLLAIYSTMRLFMGDGDYTVVTDGIADETVASNYMAMMSLLQVLAPMLTAGAILSIFYNLSSRLQYLASFNRDICIFTELNEGSLILARDMKKNHPKAAVIFTGIDPEETPAQLQEEAGNMDAILFRKDVTEVNLDLHSRKRSVWFFAISRDEQTNIHHGLAIAQRCGSRERTNLYVFATSLESEALFAAFRGQKIHIRRINRIRSEINRMLYEDGIRLYRNAVPWEDGEKQITAVVVGMGAYGNTMVKSLAWFCQMDGYRIRIHAFDEDPQAEDRFAMECPELMSEDYNGVSVPGETSYTIKFHSGIRMDTKPFADQIAKITDATYVLVDLGSEEKNIETAMTLRMLFERTKTKPVIQAVVHSSEKKKALQGLKNFKNQDYALEFIGDPESGYSENVVIDCEIEADALGRHLRYGAEEDFWAYEYNYRSSIALAIAAKIRRELKIPGADKPEEKLTEEEKKAIELLEHRRWNAYMRSEGYVFSGSTDKKTRNDLAKMHHDLTDFHSLPEEEKRKDSLVGTD